MNTDIEAVVEEFENRFFKYNDDDKTHTGGHFCGCVEGDIGGITEDGVEEALQWLRTAFSKAKEEGAREERERSYRPRITTELKTPNGGYIGSVQVISDVGFGRLQEPEIMINKMVEAALHSMVSLLMHKGAEALTNNHDN